MTNKLVVIINSLKIPKIKKILLYEMTLLVLYRNTAASRTPDYVATAPRSPFSLSSVLNRICWTPPPEQNSWVCLCLYSVKLSPTNWIKSPFVSDNKDVSHFLRWMSIVTRHQAAVTWPLEHVLAPCLLNTSRSFYGIGYAELKETNGLINSPADAIIRSDGSHDGRHADSQN